MRRVVDAAIFAGVIAAIVLALVFASPARGPLYHWQSDGGYSGIGAPATPGEVIASGAFFEFPILSRPVVLLSVRPLHPEEARGVTLRYGVWTGRESIGSADGWHPAAWHLHPVSGYVVPAHVRAGLVVGVSSKQPGIHHIRGVVVDYRIGAFTYSAPRQAGIEICVDMRRCP